MPNTFGDAANLQLVKRHMQNDPWQLPGTVGTSAYNVATGVLSISRSSITGFSEYAIAGSCANVSNVSGVKPLISLSGTQILALTLGSEYQWSRNGVVQTSLTGAIIAPTKSGTYRVRMKTSGCFTGTSDPVEFIAPTVPSPVFTVPSAINISLQDSEIKLYPNPANNLVFVELSNGKSGIYTIQLFDLIGKPVLKETVNTETTNGFVAKVDIAKLPVGIYFVKVSIGKESKVLKLLVDR